MRTMHSNKQIATAQQSEICCGVSAIAVKGKSEIPCCEQPTDGSSCCDPNEPKETNAERTGCC